MNILLLAPHPFYQDRGTPIAVDMIVRLIADRGERLDVITYHEGRDVEYPGVSLHRIPPIPFVRRIRPGFSWKKIVCDLAMFVKALRMAGGNKYDLVYSVEESVFMAMILKWVYKLPYVYDMDSSLAQQMIERFPFLAPLTSLLDYSEGIAVKNAKAVATVCDALAYRVEKYHPEKVFVVQDVSLLEQSNANGGIDIKGKLGADGLVIMYIGNLEPYQGIDLMLDSFSLLTGKTDKVSLVIIGGDNRLIQSYRKKSLQMGLEGRVHFLGPKPVDSLAHYVSQADILVSPRIKGTNTPMKIYSYLHSGKAVLATDLPTHTQVLNHRVVKLAEPSPGPFAAAMWELVHDRRLREELGEAGRRFVEEQHSPAVLYRKLNDLFDWIETEIGKQRIGIRKPG